MGKSLISSPYDPRLQFQPYHFRHQRWAIIVAHRRAGKTIATVNDLIIRAIHHLRQRKPNPRLGYVAPYRNQAKSIAWEYLKQYTDFLPSREVNESELSVSFGGVMIRLYGADNADALRGGYFDDVVLDEFADFAPRVFPEIIRPQLSDRQGGATFIGTPKGYNAFYDVWQMAQENPDWYSLMLKAGATGILPAPELADARKLMTEDQYNQEYECSFAAALIGAVYGRWIREAEEAGRVTKRVAHDPAYPVYTSWDLGFDDATAIWFWQLGNGEIFVLDYYENNGEGIGHYCEVLKSKPYEYLMHYVPHDANNKVMAAGGRSIVEQAWKDHGVRMHVIPATSQQNSIEALRKTLPRCWFSTACHEGLEALKNYCYSWDDERKVFSIKPVHSWASHACDALELMAVVWGEKAVTMQQLKDKRTEAEFFRKRREHKLEEHDPYRVKPRVKR